MGAVLSARGRASDHRVVIASAARTAVGSFIGAFDVGGGMGVALCVERA
jgi:hypothetical protein